MSAPRARWDAARWPQVALAVAMVLASALILWSGRGLDLVVDDLYYYARLVDDAGALLRYDALDTEWLLAPHNGHLQLTGKLIYEAVFGILGPDYTVLRVLELLGILTCVGLYFALARRRAGAPFALVTSVLVLFLGAAWEPMLWPFDLHTVYALAAGLGALCALDRYGARADPLACLLLLFSITTIELGLAFVVGVGILIAAERPWLRRAWVVAVPLVLYAAWWIWARRFDQGEIVWSNITDLPRSAFDSLTAVLASLTGLISQDSIPQVVDPPGIAAALSVLAIAALAMQVARRGAPVTLLAASAILLTYWAFIALADRPPDSSRYMLAGALLVLLVAAEAFRGALRLPAVIAAVAVVAAVAVPFNIAKLADGRAAHLSESTAARAHFSMLELAGERVDPAFAPWLDPAVQQAGPGVIVSLNAGDYLAAADRFGSIAFSLDELRSRDEPFRRVADATLVRALELELRSAGDRRPGSGCRTVAGRAAGFGEPFELAPGNWLLRARLSVPAELAISRFTGPSPSFSLGEVVAGRWSSLHLPPDSAPDPWLGFVDRSVRVCPGEVRR